MGFARKDVERTKMNAKKFVRYQEGAEKYSLGLTKFQELAKEAKAVYKIDMWRWSTARFSSGILNPFTCDKKNSVISPAT